MPDVIGRVPNPARRTGLNGARPLAERWTEAIDQLHRVAPGTPFTEMISEHGLDRLYDLIAQKQIANAPPPPDPQTREAMHELYNLKIAFNSCALEMKGNQRWLEYAQTDWRHRILGIHPDAFTPPPGVYSTAVGEDKFADAHEARTTVKEMHARLAWIRGICARISESKSFEAQPPGEQAIRLMQAFTARKLEADVRIEALEAAAMALNARLSRLERGKKSKPKRSTSTQRKLK
jgi:hypothetical protein